MAHTQELDYEKIFTSPKYHSPYIAGILMVYIITASVLACFNKTVRKFVSHYEDLYILLYVLRVKYLTDMEESFYPIRGEAILTRGSISKG